MSEGSYPQSALHPGGPIAQALLELSGVLVVGAALIFLGVTVLLALAVRRRAGRIHSRAWVLGGGLAFPTVVLGLLFAWSEWHRPPWRAVPPRDALVVGITGHQWWWEIRLHDPASGTEVRTANELHIPVGRPVYLGLASADVLHSFWVPGLAGKMDMVPGRMQHLLVQADRAGLWRGQCAEFCGTQHGRMALQVKGVAPADFDAWLAAQARPAAPLPDPSAARPELARGRAAFLAHRCDACHAVRGVAEAGRLGPDLTHVGSRLQLGAGVLDNDAAALQEWIAHTQAHKPGARMPASAGRIDAAGLADIAAWLAHLQ